ncbi:MAG: 3-methylitaconate isomerase [Deltaproteobacteria bacterium]|jgi:2-methylaconitate cis-trans-isomerase PrpF|nr:3-methylitaconate isomerase [Deltaproteobacteria bacterium]
MQNRIPAVLMRGGTSKGLFFHANHLPADPKVRDAAILAAYGSPDPNRRQIDGIGGAVSTTSKVAIISPSAAPDYDVVYNFGQVSIDRPLVDFKGNCGNISSAVGPFAVDEGLIAAIEPITRVRIHQINTDKLIVAEVPVKDGRFDEAGDYEIAGVPGSGSKIILRFSDPGGALTGKLFPTGNVKDNLDVPGIGNIELTVIDAANPVVLVQAAVLGLEGTEIERIDTDETLKAHIERIRCAVAVEIGITPSMEEATRRSQAVPKIAWVSEPKSYQISSGKTIDVAEVDFLARMMSMGTLHMSYAVSGAVATAGAARIPGTVLHELMSPEARTKEIMRLGHPGGIIEVGAVIEASGGNFNYKEALLGRTARRLMEGYVLVPEKIRQQG